MLPPDRVPVDRVAQHGGEIAEADPFVAAAPGALQREGPVERLAGRPVEEGEDQQQLRDDQRDAEPAVGEEGAPFRIAGAPALPAAADAGEPSRQRRGWRMASTPGQRPGVEVDLGGFEHDSASPQGSCLPL